MAHVPVARLARHPVLDGGAAVHHQRHVADALGEPRVRLARAEPALLRELRARAYPRAAAQPAGGALHELALAPLLHVAESDAALAAQRIAQQARKAGSVRELAVGVTAAPTDGAAEATEEELLTINFGPHHPATHGVLRLLDYARSRGVKRFVFGSSGGLNEEAPVAAGNLGFYLGTKLCSEVLVRNYAPLMSTVVLRFFFVYGAGQKSGMLVPRLVRSVREGTLVTLQGAEGVRLNPTYVSDAAESIARALDLEGSHTINVAGPEELSLRRMCELIGTALGRAPLFEPQPGEPRHLVGDTTKMRALLAAPRVRFADGLRFMLQEGA